ncbi:unnamed protein product [Merluccius merluccius]
MEGEKEREHDEEKESDEAEEWTLNEEDEDEEEEDEEDPEGAALAWQEGSGEDKLGLPIMHWEALSLRIAELEKQDDTFGSLERRRRPVCWMDEGRRLNSSEIWEDREEDVHMTELTSRLQTRVNLQLCFINNSESDEEEEREEENCKKVPRQVSPKAPAAQGKSKPLTGFRKALRSLRDKLRTDLTRQAAAPSGPLVKRQLERQELQAFDIKQLNSQRVSLSQDIQDLNAELVGLLQIRDHLRTEQDAMLVEVQDLTSL